MTCYLFESPIYFFFFADLAAAGIPALLYYSHIPTAIIALLVGLFVLWNGPKKLTNQLLFLITVCFFLWVLYSLISWTYVNASFIAFIWPFFAATKTLLAILCVYFVYAFLNGGKDVSNKVKTVFIILLAPVFIFAPTDLSLTGFDLVNCDAFRYEGLWFKYYYTAVSYLAMVWILYLLARAYRRANDVFKQQIIWLGVGIELFLFLFITIVFIVTYLTNLDVLNDSRLEMYALFGQTLFMVAVAFIIVRFKAFQISLVASNALIIALLILVSSQFTFVTSTTGIILTSVTLILTGVVGIVLARSVKKEITQREKLQQLTTDLAKANKRLKKLDKLKSEFVSIASHQLRSPLTAIRGYASMLTEGSFGKIPTKAVEPIERISESARLMAVAVEEYLNVSRIESGNMQYNMSDFNLRDEVEKITDDIRPVAMKKQLVLLFRNKLNSKGVVHADIGKITQIIHNLINNAIKYTPNGSITIIMRDDIPQKRLYVDIIDTGIGMNPETIDRIFEKFERADNANSVNV
jgi:signal transduction histidine kinase